MSRSYKKTPRSGDTKKKFFKNYANRVLRRDKSEDAVLNHKSYRKRYCSYDICDYETVGETFEQHWRRELKYWHNYGKYRGEPFPDRSESLKEYNKWYKRK